MDACVVNLTHSQTTLQFQQLLNATNAAGRQAAVAAATPHAELKPMRAVLMLLLMMLTSHQVCSAAAVGLLNAPSTLMHAGQTRRFAVLPNRLLGQLTRGSHSSCLGLAALVD